MVSCNVSWSKSPPMPPRKDSDHPRRFDCRQARIASPIAARKSPLILISSPYARFLRDDDPATDADAREHTGSTGRPREGRGVRPEPQRRDSGLVVRAEGGLTCHVHTTRTHRPRSVALSGTYLTTHPARTSGPAASSAASGSRAARDG